MKRTHALTLMTLASLTLLASPATASEAETSAGATGRRRRPGTATATARYKGDLGFARTDTRSGTLSAARAVALGLDEEGLSLSLSTAVAPRLGPALATNFNISIGTDGQVAHSVGRALARGGRERTASVAGRTTTGTGCHSASAVSRATGRTSYGGVARVRTTSRHHDRRPLVRYRPHVRR